MLTFRTSRCAAFADLAELDNAAAFAPDAVADVPLIALGVPVVRHAGITAAYAEVSAGVQIPAPAEEPSPKLTHYFDAYAAT